MSCKIQKNNYNVLILLLLIKYIMSKNIIWKINLINYKQLEKLKKNSDNIRQKKDWLTCIFYCELFPFENIIAKLNTTNSSQIYDEINDIAYSVCSTRQGYILQAHYTYKRVAYKIFDYTSFGNKNWTNPYSTLQLTGSYYRLVELLEFEENFILGLIQNKKSDLEKSKITRLDYAIDFMQKKENKKKISVDKKIYKYRAWTFVKKSDFYTIDTVDDNKQPLSITYETIYNWSVKSKNMFIRCYNKLLDIWKKKNYLYSDYNQFENVIRLEFVLYHKFIQDKNILQVFEVEEKMQDLLLWNYTWKIYKPVRQLDFSLRTELQQKRFTQKTIDDFIVLLQNSVPVCNLLLTSLFDNEKDKKTIENLTEKQKFDVINIINLVDGILQNSFCPTWKYYNDEEDLENDNDTKKIYKFVEDIKKINNQYNQNISLFDENIEQIEV